MATLAVWGVYAAYQAYTSYRQGQAAQQAGTQGKAAKESEAQLFDYNAAVADLQGQDAIERGAEQESRYRTQIRGTIGSLRANFGAQNIAVTYGSAVDTQADAAYLGELDALTIRTNAMREAWGFQVNAEDLRRRAVIARKEGTVLEATGRQQATTANLNAVGSIVGSASTLLQQRYAMTRASTSAGS